MGCAMNFKVKAFESYRITAGECVHLVTRGHFRSRDKEFKIAVTPFDRQKPHATLKLRGSMFYRTGVIADRSFTLQK